jgi:hypothetical protein
MKRTTRQFVALLVSGLFVSGANALTIEIEFVGGDPGPGNAGSGNLQTIFEAAASVWENAIHDPFTIKLQYGWAPVGGGQHILVSQGGSPNRETQGLIQFNNDGVQGHFVWFLDPDPLSNSAFGLRADTTADLGGGVINVGRKYSAYSSSVGADVLACGCTDLFTTAIHEIGHALGMSAANSSFVAQSGDGNIHITSPLPFAGTTLPLVPNGSAHFDPVVLAGTVMNGSFGYGIRVYPSDADVLAIAQVSGFREFNLDSTGSALTVAQSQAGGLLINSAGKWTFGMASNAYGFSVLLNGSATGGYAALLEVASGGQLYAQATDGSWWRWNNPGWSSSSAPPPPTTVSPDESTLTVPQSQAGGTLMTATGTWNFGATSNAYGNSVLLNGATNGGYATLLEVANSGQLYAKASDNSWWRWNNPGWSSSSAPTTTTVSPDGSTLTVPQSQAGGTLTTTSGTWNFGAASNAYGFSVLLNGGTNGGYAALLEVAHGGQLYAQASDNSWWRWNSPGWSSSVAP